MAHASRARAELAKARTAAMTSYTEGDYAGALPNFSIYLSNSKTIDRGPNDVDTEALLAYAKSRAAIDCALSRRHMARQPPGFGPAAAPATSRSARTFGSPGGATR